MVLTEATCYRVLGLSTAAPLEEVRRAYRRLARQLHPDVHSGDEDRFKCITAAYNVLTGRQKAETHRRAPTARATTPRDGVGARRGGTPRRRAETRGGRAAR